MATPPPRPSYDEYFMRIAMAVRLRANCLGKRVGAVLVRDGRVIATGYNGTPEDTDNCVEGGCHRCADTKAYPSGSFYDVCICVHGEQNVLLSAARFGIATEGAVLYTTMRPCFGCTKELLQARVSAVHFIHDWVPREELRAEYEKLQARFPRGIHRQAIDDPDELWALGGRRVPTADCG